MAIEKESRKEKESREEEIISEALLTPARVSCFTESIILPLTSYATGFLHNLSEITVWVYFHAVSHVFDLESCHFAAADFQGIGLAEA